MANIEIWKKCMMPLDLSCKLEWTGWNGLDQAYSSVQKAPTRDEIA